MFNHLKFRPLTNLITATSLISLCNLQKDQNTPGFIFFVFPLVSLQIHLQLPFVLLPATQLYRKKYLSIFLTIPSICLTKKLNSFTSITPLTIESRKGIDENPLKKFSKHMGGINSIEFYQQHIERKRSLHEFDSGSSHFTNLIRHRQASGHDSLRRERGFKEVK